MDHSRVHRTGAYAATLLLLGVSLTACSADRPATDPSTGATACQYPPSGEPARPVDPPEPSGVATTGTAAYLMKTNQGDVTLTVDRAKAPCAAHSFDALARQHFFDDSRCHRLVDSGIFVLQCGDPTGSGRGGPGYRFKDETSRSDRFTAGTVAMANAGPDTNGSQFFLVYQDSPLPPNYTVFAKMDQAGTGVIARIAAEGQDGSNPDGTGKPNNPAQIISLAPAR